MKINPVVFREYDIRGMVDKDLSDEFAYLLGRAYANFAKEHQKNVSVQPLSVEATILLEDHTVASRTRFFESCGDVANENYWPAKSYPYGGGLNASTRNRERLQKNNIGIGYDCRKTSKGYATALARGITDEGLDCIVIGMTPTPVLYYAIFKKVLGGGIQVTGSHNPPDMNGFKISIGTRMLTGAEIQGMRERMTEFLHQPPKITKKGSITELNVVPDYIGELIANCRPYIGPRKLRVVVDAGNGVGGITGVAILKGLGVELIELFCEPDGNFPNHHPDPTVPESLAALINAVKKNRADFGIGWDGDADRIGIIDERGEVIYGDMLLLLYAREILKSEPGITVVGDVKCSSNLFNDMAKRGAHPIMWKTGHSLMKNKVHESGAAIGGEMSGHIYFKHRFYGFDDAVYAAARFVEIASNFNGPISQTLTDVPKTVVTPEIRVDCPEEIKFLIPEKLREVFKDYPVDQTDGARITFDKGWGLARASNTQSILVLRFEAEDRESLNSYQKLVTEKIEEIKRELMGRP